LSIAGSSEPKISARSRKLGRPLDVTKRQAIIDAAVRSFFHEGYAGTAIEQVAAAAGVSKVTIYNQFGDKRGLFAAAVECECERMRVHFSLHDMPAGTIGERLTAIGEAIVAFLWMLQFERRIASETEQDPAIGAAFLEAGPRRMKQGFSAYLRHAVAVGDLRIDDTDLAAEQFVSMCKGMRDLECRFGGEVTTADHRQRIDGAVKVFLAAYGPRDDR